MISGMCGLTLSAIGGIWDRVKAGAIVVIFNIGIAVLIIPKFGSIGASIASVITQSIFAFLLVIILKRKFQITLPWRLLLKAITIGFICAGVLPYLLMDYFASYFGAMISVIIAAFAYFFMIRVFGLSKMVMQE